jgi:nucleoside-diphosphate-sugar epimerase
MDFAFLERAFSGHDAVIHLAAIPNPRSAPADVTFNTNVQGSWNVLQAAENAGVTRVVVASSDAATGLHYNPKDWDPRYLPIDEQHPLRPVEFYSLSKEVTEVMCRCYANRGKLEVKIIRPTHIVFEPEWPELAARGADPNNYHLWTYVEPEDVAQGLRRAVEVKDGAFDTFFITAANTLSNRPTLEILRERLGYLPEVRNPELFTKNPSASPFDISHARAVLGYEPTSDWKRLFARVPEPNRHPVRP